MVWKQNFEFFYIEGIIPTSKNAINCAMNDWTQKDLKVTKSRNNDFY